MLFCLFLFISFELHSWLDLSVEALTRDYKRAINDCVSSVDATFVVMAGLCPHKCPEHLVGKRLSCSALRIGLSCCCSIFGYDTGEEAELAETVMLADFTVAEHQCGDHRRVDPFHDEVCGQTCVLPICFLSLKQVLFELVVEKVVATTFLLRLHHEFLRVLQGPLDYFIDLSSFLAEILQTPDSLE